MRQSSMETLAESRKRKAEGSDDGGGGGGGKPKRIVSNGTGSIAYLQMRLEIHAELKREEI